MSKKKYLLFVFETLTNPCGEYRYSEVDAIAAMDLSDDEIELMW